MPQHSDPPDQWNEMRDRIIGMGETSVHKSYYPQLQQRLAELERFRALIDQTSDMILVVRAPGLHCIDANRACSALLGYSHGELMKRDVTSLFAPEERQHISAIILRAAESLQQETAETVLLTMRGWKIPVEVSVRFVTLDREEYGVIAAHDIRDRRRYERELLTTQKKLNLINFLTRNEIKGHVFIVRAYLDILRQMARHPEEVTILDKLTEATLEIGRHLEFAENYQAMGRTEPRWLNFNEVFLFALSHLPPITIAREGALKNIEILADPLLEKGLTQLLEHIYHQGAIAAPIRLAYQASDEGLVIVLEKDAPGVPAGKKESIFAWQKEKNSSQNLFLIREILAITGISIRECGDDRKLRFEIVVPREGYTIS